MAKPVVVVTGVSGYVGAQVEVAVAGTMAAMKAATTHGIKRVVVTSSCAAIFACNSLAPLAEGVLFDETMWSNVDFLKSGALPQVDFMHIGDFLCAGMARKSVHCALCRVLLIT